MGNIMANPGTCILCHKTGVSIYYLERFPDRTLKRTKTGQAQGICTECELSIKVSKKELLKVLSIWTQHTIHHYAYIRELVGSLSSSIKYTAKDVIKQYNVTNKDIRSIIEGLFIAATRVRRSDGTPLDMKRAARSIFIMSDIHWLNMTSPQLEKEYGKWYIDYY